VHQSPVDAVVLSKPLPYLQDVDVAKLWAQAMTPLPISSILLLAKLYKCIYQLVYRPAYLSVTTQRKHLYSHIQAY